MRIKKPSLIKFDGGFFCLFFRSVTFTISTKLKIVIIILKIVIRLSK